MFCRFGRLCTTTQGINPNSDHNLILKATVKLRIFALNSLNKHHNLAQPLLYSERLNKMESFMMFLLSALANLTYKSRNLKALSITYTQYRLCDLNKYFWKQRETNECTLIT
jgi:hypothetical protein